MAEAPRARGPASRRHPLLLPALATVIAFAILAGLGVWQLQRREWKTHLIESIEARARGEAQPLPPQGAWDGWTAEKGEYQRAVATGTYDYGAEVPVHGLAPGEGPGQPLQGNYLLTPLKLAGGGTVVVNRGFVPSGWKGPVDRPAGQVTVTGITRAPEAQGLFVPENDPARDEWFTRDPAAIAHAKGLTGVAPFLLDAEATPGVAWPRAGLTVLDVPNNHLQYAFTWFGIAATLVGVFVSFALSRRHAGRSAP